MRVSGVKMTETKTGLRRGTAGQCRYLERTKNGLKDKRNINDEA
jgi:hypothetical protein